MGWVQDDLVRHSDYVFERTRSRLDGLTDDEWAWEPAPWCWSVRRVGGRWQADGTPLPLPAEPISTIAWRLDHLILNYGQTKNAEWLGLEPQPLPPTTGSARAELERLGVVARRWHDLLAESDDESLATPIGPIGARFAAWTRASYVHHQLDEMIHHGAELGVLRDLYRARSLAPPALDTVTQAAAAGRWDRVVELAEAGAEVNGGSFSALHLAVAARARPVVRVLLAHGADRDAKDEQYGMDALGWARFFEDDELVTLLSS